MTISDLFVHHFTSLAHPHVGVLIFEHIPSQKIFRFPQLLEYEGDRPGVRVVTEARRNTVSRLLVTNATESDTGRYTCKPSNGRPATITLHVLEGG